MDLLSVGTHCSTCVSPCLLPRFPVITAVQKIDYPRSCTAIDFLFKFLNGNLK